MGRNRVTTISELPASRLPSSSFCPSPAIPNTRGCLPCTEGSSVGRPDVPLQTGSAKFRGKVTTDEERGKEDTRHQTVPFRQEEGKVGLRGSPRPFPVDSHSMSLWGAQKSCQGCSRAFSRPSHEDPDSLRQTDQGQAASEPWRGTFQGTGEESAGNVCL